MGTFRTWVALGAALVVTLAFGHSPAGAQSQSTEVGAPLSLAPPAANARKAARAKRIARAIRKAKRSFAYVRPAQQQQQPAHVIGGAQSVALVAQLPWWQSSESTRQRYQVAAVASPVLTAADAFVDAKAAAGQPYSTARLSQTVENDDVIAQDTTVGTAVSSTAVSSVVDAGELNALDRSTAPPDKPWLTGLMVMLAGALAAIGAARFLFAR